MTRFQQELSGILGPYWVGHAEREVIAAVEMARNEATVDENGAIAWKSNGSYLMDDLCEKLDFAGYPFSWEATKAARAEQVDRSIAEYRRNYRGLSDAELRETRAAFGEGTTVVDVLSGREIRL